MIKCASTLKIVYWGKAHSVVVLQTESLYPELPKQSTALFGHISRSGRPGALTVQVHPGFMGPPVGWDCAFSTAAEDSHPGTGLSVVIATNIMVGQSTAKINHSFTEFCLIRRY